MLCYQMFSFAIDSNFHTTVSQFVHSSLVDQLYATVINCVTKSNNSVQHAPNIYPDVFNSFHRTVIHGESYRIFTKPLTLKRRFPTFHYRTSSFCYLPIFLHQNLQNYLKANSHSSLTGNNHILFLSGFSFMNIHRTGLQGKGEDIYLFPHYHFHFLHRH